jgi:hypothetical protein
MEDSSLSRGHIVGMIRIVVARLFLYFAIAKGMSVLLTE